MLIRPKKYVTIKGLADFMTASPTSQRTIIKQYKYPDEDDARAKILYYRDARDIIVAYHSSRQTKAWLDEQAKRLDSIAVVSSGRRRARLRHNSRAINAYNAHFSDKEFEILDDIAPYIICEDVYVSVRPDLHVRERGREKIIKLEFGEKPPKEALVKVISQAMLDSLSSISLDIPSSQVHYYDVPRGREFRSARVGARMRSDIEASCKNFSAIWDKI